MTLEGWLGLAGVAIPLLIGGVAAYIDLRLRDNDQKHENEQLKQRLDWYHEGMVELKQLIKSYKRPSDGSTS